MNSKQRILCFVHLLALQIFGNACFTKAAGQPGGNLKLFAANHPYIQYVGRINLAMQKPRGSGCPVFILKPGLPAAVVPYC
jgi:hypothetical protein